MTEHIEWNDRYRDDNLPWDTGRPSAELQRVLGRNPILSCRALELGCGTGTNSVWLAQQGFEVTGIDLACKGRDLCQPPGSVNLDSGDQTNIGIGNGECAMRFGGTSCNWDTACVVGQLQALL